MSGHSKWSTIKRQKAATDSARGQVFTKLGNAITIAVKEGGSSDPEVNIRLRLLVDKAKSANMPKNNIERAIDRAVGKGKEGTLITVVYEGFGPSGVAVLVQGVTDNTQRTSQEVKNVFHISGGTLGGVGSVSYLFDQVGEIHVEKKGETPDEILSLALDLGADDMEEEADRFILYSKPQHFAYVRTQLVAKGFYLLESELSFRAKTPQTLGEKETQQLLELLKNLDELGDIHKVYSNANLILH